ncbi:hypothetical protein BGZ99_009421 [Dissophora globulifera]|uniref:USP8 dimerisation domain-containing protein n=1 Tax=Dissophora globulifera TaxID=979702 RepID=A0A9P6V0T6_9FUNG|nr:hypothetical protein BGZ99_009421 [Dissophora globulifera]
MESGIAMTPRTRLHELKSSADFASEEFNHSIKTWVNMASLLVKQGNMAESNKDDENAYISYVRACIIITKIIPHQALYPTMMNDIVCIDLRQKVLIIISRMAHLERRLLKRFEQEHQGYSRVANSDNTTTPTSTPPSSKQSNSTARSSPREESQDEGSHSLPRMTFRQSEEFQEDKDFEVISLPQENVEEYDIKNHVEAIYEVASDATTHELDPHVRVSHCNEYSDNNNSRRDYRRRTMTCDAQNASYHFQRKIDSADPANARSSLPLKDTPVLPTLKKKSSNEDSRLLLSPECQPNYSAILPSALFARQREGGHVRRCSSTDAVRASIHFPTAYPVFDDDVAPAIPPRSDKRSSMWAGSSASQKAKIRNSNSSINDQYDNKRIEIEPAPTHRKTASTMELSSSPSSSGQGREGMDKVIYDAQVMKCRLAKRRTMSFESSGTDGSNVMLRTISSQLRKSNSISRLYPIPKTNKEQLVMPPAPRVSVERLDRTDEVSSTLLINTSMSLSTISIDSSSASSVSSGLSTPSTSPQLNTHSPLMQTSSFTAEHGYSTSTASLNAEFNSNMGGSSNLSSPLSRPPHSLPAISPRTSSVTVSSSLAQHKQTSSISGTTIALSDTSSSMTTATTTATESSSSSPLLASISSWSPMSSSKTGLLRKIRSRPKVKDQIFEIVAAPSTPSPLPSSYTT